MVDGHIVRFLNITATGRVFLDVSCREGRCGLHTDKLHFRRFSGVDDEVLVRVDYGQQLQNGLFRYHGTFGGWEGDGGRSLRS